MIRANATSQDEVMAIKIVRIGSDTLVVRVPVGSTVADALDAAGESIGSSEKMSVDGVDAMIDDELQEGDILSIITEKGGGLK